MTIEEEEMKRRMVLVIGIAVFLAWFSLPLSAATYYVSLSGNDSNPGYQSEPWRTITYAATRAQAGDTVYIEAGNYGAEHVVISNSGTSSSPIVFEGYKNTPGDIPEPGPFDIHREGGLPPPVLNAGEMPLLHGGGSVITGIDLSSRKYVEIKNVQITGYSTSNSCGISAESASDLIFNNIVIFEGARDGIMIKKSDRIKILNCQVYGCDMSNIILLTTNNSLIENCLAGDKPGGIVSDYYISIAGYYGNSYGNTIRHCYANNNHKGADGHYGHGICLKGYGGYKKACIKEFHFNFQGVL